MKLFRAVFLVGLLRFVQAAESQKSVVVTYPQDTPNSVLNMAKNAVIDAVRHNMFLGALLPFTNYSLH